MNFLQQYIPVEIIEALGWSFVHSLWQASIVAFCLTIVLLFMQKSKANIRYWVSFASLIVIIGWTGNTFIKSFQQTMQRENLRTEIQNNPSLLKQKIKTEFSIIDSENSIEKTSFNLSQIKIRSAFQRNFPIIVLFWAIGILFFIFRFLGGFLYAQRLKTTNLDCVKHNILEIVEHFSERLQLKKKVKIFHSLILKSTITIGHIKPVILLPISAISGLSSKEIEAIIAHELAHIARNDYFFNLLQKTIEIVFFFHPAIWLISRYIDTERENSCDDVAIKLTGDKITYAKALYHSEHSFNTQIAMTFLPQKGGLLQRIKRINNGKAMKTNVTEGLIATLIIGVGLTLLSFTLGSNLHVRENPIEFGGQHQNSNFKSNTPTKSDNQVEKKEAIERRDSLISGMDKKLKEKEFALQKKNEELAKAIEIALSESNAQASEQMLTEIESVMNEIDIEKIMQEAMTAAIEVQKNMDMQAIMENALKNMDQLSEEELQEMQFETQKAIAQAQKELQEIDYEQIQQEMDKAMEEAQINHEKMREEWTKALQEAKTELKKSRVEMQKSELEMQKAMKEAQAGMIKAQKEIRGLNLDSIINAAMKEAKEEMQKEMENDSLSDAQIELMQSGINAASSVLQNMDMNALMQGVMGAVGTGLSISGETIRAMGKAMENLPMDSTNIE